MSQWKPCKRRDFIRKLSKLCFKGPYSGTRHQFLIFENHRMAIPSNAEYSMPELRIMIRKVEEILDRKINLDEWEKL